MPEEIDETNSTQSRKHLAALLFTDLVDSVAVQNRLGTEAYTRFVRKHDEIFHQCLSQIPGARILNETGDGYLVRFPTPSDAVLSALRLQQLFHNAEAEGQPIRIRIGLHLGVITEIGNPLRGETRAVGMPINLAARIMDLAEGGQILMSRAVYDDARQFVRSFSSGQSEPATLQLQWLAHGSYEIKGAEEPIEVFEVGIDSIAPLRPPKASGKAAPARKPHQAEEDEPDLLESPPEQSDVFISYAPVDNRPLSAERRGWISQFHRNLAIRVEQLCGRRLNIWRPTRVATGAGEIDARILEFLPNVKAMVSVLSPPFVNSEHCLRELEAFWQSAEREGTLHVSGRTRMLKVVKTPLEEGQLPPQVEWMVKQLLGFDFYELDPETGRVREYAEASGPLAEQRFHERVYDLAQEVNSVIKALDDSQTTFLRNEAERRTVYLATTSSELEPSRDRIRRELLGQGHKVLPDHPLPLLASEMEQTVTGCLEKCDLVIHPIGAHYGVVPEGSDLSSAALQNKVAAEYSAEKGLPRIIWIPRDLTARDPRQAQLIQALKTDPAHHRNAEIVIDTLEELKSIILVKLNPPAPKSERSAESQGARRIYLICDRRDESAVEPLEDYLFEEGFEVSLPDFDADETEAAEAHREHLRDCDGAIIYYGAARSAWVDIKLRNILKASGYGRETELAFSAVYIAPPFDRRKERFRTHNAEIIRQPEQFDPSVLEPVLARIKLSN